MSDLSTALSNPAVQAGLGLLTTARPDIGLALQVVTTLLQGWKEKSQINVAIKAIDARAAEHVNRLATQKLHPVERSEIEIRLHELLTVLIKMGGL
jgi:hypothetical protein